VADIQAVRPSKRNQTARISLRYIVLSKSEAKKPSAPEPPAQSMLVSPEFQRWPPVPPVYGNAATLVNSGFDQNHEFRELARGDDIRPAGIASPVPAGPVPASRPPSSRITRSARFRIPGRCDTISTVAPLRAASTASTA
jgi:hypothetical protein